MVVSGVERARSFPVIRSEKTSLVWVIAALIYITQRKSCPMRINTILNSSAGADLQPQPSSQSDGWRRHRAQYHHGSTRGMECDRASLDRSERWCWCQIRPDDPAHRVERCW